MMRWLKNLFKKKKDIRYQDNGYLVQDYRGMVITQEEHRRQWGFPGYPTRHDTNCDCTHCTTATHHYRINTGNFRYNSEGIIREADFLPKKKIKAHKIVERKYTMRGPGVYIREVDYSTIDLNGNCIDLRTVRRNRDE